jgi:hypothetical protein
MSQKITENNEQVTLSLAQCQVIILFLGKVGSLSNPDLM